MKSKPIRDGYEAYTIFEDGRVYSSHGKVK